MPFIINVLNNSNSSKTLAFKWYNGRLGHGTCEMLSHRKTSLTDVRRNRVSPLSPFLDLAAASQLYELHRRRGSQIVELFVERQSPR